MSESQISMTSNRPYLIRAIYEWLTDNQLTAQLLVDTSSGKVKVPQHLIKDNQIILNISPQAISGLSLDNHLITFNTRFSGRSFLVSIPVSAVLAIFARENGQGMAFPDEDFETEIDHELQIDNTAGNEVEKQRVSKKTFKTVEGERVSSKKASSRPKSKASLKVIK